MPYIVLLCWLAACALQDAMQRKIANLLTLGGLFAALLYLLCFGSSITGANPTAAALAMAVACLLSLPGYISRRMGAADVKMLVALGAASDSLHVLLSVIGAAGVLVSWVVLLRIKPAVRLAVPEELIYLRTSHSNEQPYAPFLCLGFAITAL